MSMHSLQLTRRACAITSASILIFFCVFGLVFRSQSPLMSIIVIPGGGLTVNGELPLHSQLRLDRAIEIYRLTDSDNFIFITLSAGTTHKPCPLDKDGFPIYESVAATKKLIEMGVPSNLIWEESLSLDTLGNAYFLRTIHIDQIERIRKIIVITNNWHVDRVKAIFEFVFSLPEYHNVAVQAKSYKLSFESVPDGLQSDVLANRKARELDSLNIFLNSTKNHISSMRSLHDWLFSEHLAYAAKRHTLPRGSIDSSVLKSY